MHATKKADRLTINLPPNACDCHTHIFEKEALFPFASDRTYTPGFAPLDGLLSHLKQCHLQRVVLVQASPYGTDNSCMLDVMRKIPDMARGVVVIDKTITDEQLQQMHECGVRGARINLQTHGIFDPKYAAVELKWLASRIAPFGWHIQIFTSLPVLQALKGVILSLPTPIVIDHFGQVRAAAGVGQAGLDDLLELLSTGSAWVKLSAAQRISDDPTYANVAPIVAAFVQANPNRLLWGSDWPHPGARPGIARNKQVVEPFNDINDIYALNSLASWIDNSDLLKQILADNPRELYGFSS